MEANQIKPWTFFTDKQKRLFMIVDYNVGGDPNDNIHLMEVKPYGPDEKRSFGLMPAKDFARRVNKEILKEVTPRI